ncbi:Kexin [Spathaspora sp. JA1]|nr:Kexin [Spathaspora sp. JA1]
MLLPFNILILVLGSLISLSLQQVLPRRDYENNNYFLVELNTTSSQKPLVDFIEKYRSHYTFDHQLPLDNYYVFKINKSHPHNTFLGNYNNLQQQIDQPDLIKRSGFEDVYHDLINSVDSIHMLPPKKLSKRMPVPIDHTEMELIARDNELDPTNAAKQKFQEISSKLDIKDPIFSEQWHLFNKVHPGHDVNVVDLWLEGQFGEGIVTAIVDDGLDATSEDLQANFNAKGSWDFNNNGALPLPRLFDDYHGTRCAGEIAAVKNDVCGVGVAYKSQVSGIRILSGPITGADEAAALMYGLDVNDIYSCSWGPTDNGRTLAEPDLIVKEAIVKGITEGRKNKGAVYVFASGNGARYEDSCNFDGYTNSIYSITVGAIDYQGLHPSYAEACSAVMVVTYSSGSGEHIHTTDIKKRCADTHGGTSAAAPLASGIYSLVLSANPNLTWRDVQYVSVLAAVPVNEYDGSYQTTALGRKYSHKYGYGKLDATKIVKFGQTWKNVKPQAWYYCDIIKVGEVINKDKTKVIKSSVNITQDDLKLMNVERVEHITVKVNIESSYRGKVGMRIISPSGVVSELATFRSSDAAGTGFPNWTFMSVAHWGENGIGEWNVAVFASDDNVSITLVDWQLRLFGESIDADKATKFDLKTDYAAVRRELQNNSPTQPTTSSTSSSSTTTDTPPPETSSEATSSTSSEIASTSSETSTPITSEETEPTDEGDKTRVGSDHTGQYLMALAIVGFIKQDDDSDTRLLGSK